MARALSTHPDFQHFLRRLATIIARAGSLRQVVFRCVEPTYATENDLLTGEGSRKNGGRWNPPSSFATVYAALSDATALAESKANYLYYGLDPADAWPRTIVAVDVKLAKVLDLTDGMVRKALAVSATRMRGDDWRALNRRARNPLPRRLGGPSMKAGWRV